MSRARSGVRPGAGDGERRLRAALEAADLAVWEIDLAAGVLRVDRVGAARLGLGVDGAGAGAEVSLRRGLRLLDRRDRRGLLRALRAHLAGRADRFRAEARTRRAASGGGGRRRWLELRGLAEAAGAGAGPRAARVVGVAVDVTARKEAELRLAALALEDHLTRLPNRRALDAALGRTLARAERAGERVGLLLLDLNGFKAVNDRLGHQAGDALLAEVATRLRSAVRRGDLVARFGGDEFAVVAHGVRARRQLEGLARRVIAATGVAVRLPAPGAADGEGAAEHPGLSVGIAVYPEDGPTPAALLARADGALYEAKRARAGFCFAGEAAAAG